MRDWLVGSVGSLVFWRVAVLGVSGILGVRSLACGAERVFGENGGGTIIMLVIVVDVRLRGTYR